MKNIVSKNSRLTYPVRKLWNFTLPMLHAQNEKQGRRNSLDSVSTIGIGPRIIILGILIFISCLLAFGFGMLVYRKYAPPSQFVIPIHADQVEIPTHNTLKHYYTFLPEQKLVYKAPWLPEPVVNFTNKDGLVDRFDYSPAKMPGVIRIIALGDSFTQGIMVETGQSYPELLEDRLSENRYDGIDKVEVLNFGVGGYDIEYAANKLKLQGMKYQPDLVMWMVKLDDLYLVNERMSGVRGSLQDELVTLGIDGVSRELNDYYQKLYVLGEVYTRTFKAKSLLEYQTGKFREIRTFYRGPLLVLYFDEDDPLVIDTLMDLQKEDQNLILVSIPSGIGRFPDTHPDKEGHAAIAEFVSPFISAFITDQNAMIHARKVK